MFSRLRCSLCLSGHPWKPAADTSSRKSPQVATAIAAQAYLHHLALSAHECFTSFQPDGVPKLMTSFIPLKLLTVFTAQRRESVKHTVDHMPFLLRCFSRSSHHLQDKIPTLSTYLSFPQSYQLSSHSFLSKLHDAVTPKRGGEGPLLDGQLCLGALGTKSRPE